MRKEIHFNKYELRGQDYHYKQINKRNLGSFNAYVFARYQIELDLLKKICKLNNNNKIRILDVGCGDGVSIYLMNQQFKNKNLEIHGIDSSEMAIEIANRKNPNSVFKVADVYNLPFEENHFDIVISSDVIEHVSKPEKMLSEIKRVCNNNSFIIIGTPIRYTEKPLDKMHYQEFFPHDFEQLLCKFFNKIEIIQSHKLLYLLLFNKVSSIYKFEILFYRYLINFITIYLKKNPFLKLRSTMNQNESFSYMFGLGTVNK